MGGEFTSVSDRMQAKFEPGRLEDVVGYLMKGKGKRLAAFTEQSIARELLGIVIPELKWADTVESVVGREGLPPAVDMKDLNAVRQQLAETFAASTDEQGSNLEEHSQLSGETAESSPDSSEEDEAPTIGGETTRNEQFLDEEPLPTLAKTEATNPTANAQPTIQKPEAHRLRFKAERQVAQFLHEAGLAQAVMSKESLHLKVENTPYLPLVLETHTVGNEKLLYLTHYREQNGDLIHDGEMVFGIKQSGHLQLKETAVQNGFTGGELRGYDREFAAIFSRNILEQGFAIEARKHLAAQSAQNSKEQMTRSAQTPAPEREGTEEQQLSNKVARAKTNQLPDNTREPQTTLPRSLIEKGERAAKYIGDTELAHTIRVTLAKQDKEAPDVIIASLLQAQVKTTIALARNKQQTEFASEILPIAQRLLKIANQAGLTRSKQTEQGQITVFEGKNYSVRCRTTGDKEEFKLLCHHTNGLIYAVNGASQKSKGLIKADGIRLAKYANMAPSQLRQVIRMQQKKAGIEV